MVNIDNALGKKIKITNSLNFLELKDKYDYFFDLDYENIIYSISNLSTTLSEQIGVDSKKVKLYSIIYGLGKVDGGKVTLDYINSKQTDQSKMINEYEIMISNLKKIFPDFNEKFNSNVLEELKTLYINQNGIIETEIVKAVACLKLIAQYMKSIGKLNDQNDVDFIFNEMQKIILNYKNTNNFNYENLKNYANSIYSKKIDLTPEDIQSLNIIINKFSTNSLKENLIDDLNSYRIAKEKKIKTK